MRILIAASSQYIAFHGQAIFTVNLAEELVRNGHSVMVLVASEKGRPYHSEHKGVQVEAVTALDMKLFHPDVYLALATSRTIRQVLLNFQPDIIHIQDHYPLCNALVRIAHRLRIKVVGTNHFMPENLAPYVPVPASLKPAFKRALWQWMRLTYDHVEAVVGPSRTAAGILRAAGLRPPVLSISCGVNTGLFHPDPSVDRVAWRTRYGIDPKKIIFFFVGRVDREKRLDVILRALRLMDRDDIQVVIASRGAFKERLIGLAKHLELGNRVHFTGFIPQANLPPLLNSIDIFTMPSEAELLSISTLQAMGCARPILAVNAVALPELVSEGINGLIFKPGDVAEAARCMEWFADHPERWAPMGAASLERVKEHSLEHIVRQYERLYEDVLNGAPLDPFSKG